MVIVSESSTQNTGIVEDASFQGGDFVRDAPASPASGRRASFYMVFVDAVRAASIAGFCAWQILAFRRANGDEYRRDQFARQKARF